ncbi:response regulator [Streptomyces phaeochromogenes]|uniref:response regulator n=1 Tax=Streptomyces phaeochromogenes TaxID=1923 RepID=UPI00386A98D7|nr:response regulator transcription factor [Streptomyces phaeochromogenes]
MTTAPIRILVADDQRDIRIGFRMILDAQPDMRTVGEAADGADAIDCARRLRPDVVLADIRMPGPDGLEVTRVLAGPDAAHPTKVIVVTTFDLDEYVYTALANGACGFLLKRSGPALLTEAVRAAVAGDVLISPSVTVRLLRHLAPRSSDHHLSPTAPLTEPLTEPLTDREAEVARLVAQGRTNAEIGTALFITAGTAKTHVANIQRKLDVRNRVGIAAWTWRNSQTGRTGPDRPRHSG